MSHPTTVTLDADVKEVSLKLSEMMTTKTQKYAEHLILYVTTDVKTLDLKTGKEVHFKGSKNNYICSAIVEGERLITGHDGGQINIYSLKTGKLLTIIKDKAYDGYHASCLLLIDNKTLAKGSSIGHLQFFDFATKDLVHSESLNSPRALLNVDETRFFVLSQFNALQIRDKKTFAVLVEKKETNAKVPITFDNKLVCVIGGDKVMWYSLDNLEVLKQVLVKEITQIVNMGDRLIFVSDNALWREDGKKIRDLESNNVGQDAVGPNTIVYTAYNREEPTVQTLA
jgi:hypothetical protein